MSRNSVSCGSQCGPALLSILNGRGKVEGTVGALVLLQVYFKQDLDSHDLLRGAPPGPNSQGRGAALRGVGAHTPATEPPLEQPRPGRAPSPICFLSARPLRRQPADRQPAGRRPAPACLSSPGRQSTTRSQGRLRLHLQPGMQDHG